MRCPNKGKNFQNEIEGEKSQREREKLDPNEENG
jgi:hypothetical protein